MSARLELASIASALAVADAVHESIAGARYHHARSPAAAVVMSLVVVALLVLVPRTGSRALARAAGIACGGALGNLLSVVVWRHGVPDPIVVSGVAGGVAFNLADVFALLGDAAMLSAAAVYAIRRREALGVRV